MPKQTYTLNNFSGGINNLKDPRDLQENELANGVDIMIDKQGAIRTRGGEVDYDATINDRTATVAAGYGLAVFESDFALANTSYSVTGTANGNGNAGNSGAIDFGNNEVDELGIDFNVSNANGPDKFQLEVLYLLLAVQKIMDFIQ